MDNLNKKIIDLARDGCWKVCIYGLGFLGKRIAGRLSDILHLKIDFYCDGNPQVVDSFHLSDATGIYKEELMKTREAVLVPILVDYPYDDEICKELAENSCLHPVRLRDIAALDEVMANFYGDELYERYLKLETISDRKYEAVNRRKERRLVKTAVYTCITGGYDRLWQPDVAEEHCDYYVISDEPDMGGGVFRYLDVDAVVPDRSMNAKDKNRYCKMNPYEIFEEYDYAIYLDGSIRIKSPIAHYIKTAGFSGLGIHRHKIQDCIYVDGIFAEWLGVVEKDKIFKELKRYIEEGLPKKFGMFECGMIVTDLRNKLGQQLYRKWYEEYQKGAKRDQFSLIYALWKMGLTANAIGNLSPGRNIWTNPDIVWDRKAHYV